MNPWRFVKRAIYSGLLLVNVVLGITLAWKFRLTARARTVPRSQVAAANDAPKPIFQSAKPLPSSEPPTPYAAVYSPRPADFAANLRRVGCPEETVKDILFAEISRRYRAQEKLLRPKPADHVPFMWSPKTSEAKLIERRQQAAAIAREKADALRAALGYEVNVSMPLYAMTTGDQRFEKELEQIPPKKRQAAHAANEQYWLMIEQLRNRTQGFWEPADVEELNQLKRQRREELDRLREARP
jgi:hypothetical protein